MANKSAEELKNLSPQELDDKLSAFRRQLTEYRFQLASGKLDKPSKVKSVRRDIARILTIKNQPKG